MRKNIMKKIIAAVCTVSMVMGSTGFDFGYGYYCRNRL